MASALQRGRRLRPAPRAALALKPHLPRACTARPAGEGPRGHDAALGAGVIHVFGAAAARSRMWARFHAALICCVAALVTRSAHSRASIGVKPIFFASRSDTGQSDAEQ